MRAWKGEPGAHCLRVRSVFQEFLQIVFSVYLCRQWRNEKPFIRTFTYNIRTVLAPLYCLTRCVRSYIIAGGIKFTLNDRKGKQSLVVSNWNEIVASLAWHLSQATNALWSLLALLTCLWSGRWLIGSRNKNRCCLRSQLFARRAS